MTVSENFVKSIPKKVGKIFFWGFKVHIPLTILICLIGLALQYETLYSYGRLLQTAGMICVVLALCTVFGGSGFERQPIDDPVYMHSSTHLKEQNITKYNPVGWYFLLAAIFIYLDGMTAAWISGYEQFTIWFPK